MKYTRVAMPWVGLIAATRTALGVGIGLLASRRLTSDARRRAGIALVVTGAVTTVPLALAVISGMRRAQEAF